MMTTHIVIQFAGILCPPEDAHGGALQRSRLAAKEILQLSAQRPPATVIYWEVNCAMHWSSLPKVVSWQNFRDYEVAPRQP